MVTEVLNSPLSRELLADILNAVAAVLRQERAAGQQVADAAEAVADTGVNLMSTAASVSADVRAGATDTGSRITAAAMDMAEVAAGALARAGTQAIINMLPSTGGASQDDRGQPERGTRRKSEPNESGS